ncbi:MAG: transglycosylase domain-containing protein [Candidatus Schekmanbacteria bacterium]|nr:transglycosylase domain-containing protein [Candidatus Schekmanbacteria bacterium]
MQPDNPDPADLVATPARRGRARRALTIIASLVAALCAIGGGIGASLLFSEYRKIEQSLPNVAAVRNYRNNSVTTIVARDGRPLHEFTVERRYPVPMAQVPEHMINALIAVEDERFFYHRGIDPMGILRAAWENLQAGRIVEGASTLTQQLARELFLSRDRRFLRKFKEQLVALQMEKILTKNEILELYLNEVYFGHGAYGVEAAAQAYFGKSVADTTIAEAAMIAGMPQAPSRYSPVTNPELAEQRRAIVLRRMLEQGYITAQEHVEAEAEHVRLAPTPTSTARDDNGYFLEHVRRTLEEKFGSEAVHRGGLTVVTSLDPELQAAAQEAVRFGLHEHSRRHGFRGPISPASILPQWSPTGKEKVGDVVLGKIEAIADGAVAVRLHGTTRGRLPRAGYSWAGTDPQKLFKVGERYLFRIAKPASTASASPEVALELEQAPRAQAALVAMDVRTGDLLALVGGYDFAASKFNRATQSRRQPGSAFKPIVYAAALENGFAPSSVVYDAPIIKGRTAEAEAWLHAQTSVSERLRRLRVIDGSTVGSAATGTEPAALERDVWKPGNYSGKFNGATTVRGALEKSLNLVTIKLISEIGVDLTVAYGRAMGIESELGANLSLALGSSGLSLLELTSAYSTFPGQGWRAVPRAIAQVRRDDEVLWTQVPEHVPVLGADTAYQMTYIMQGVIESGTGQAARRLYFPALGGKTGTTNEYRDAWFVGFSPSMVVGVWIGYDELRSLGSRETGATAALPIWIRFMSEALKRESASSFAVPDAIHYVAVDAETGELAGERCPKIRMEAFRTGQEPTTVCHRHDPTAVDFSSLDLGLPAEGVDALTEQTTGAGDETPSEQSAEGASPPTWDDEYPFTSD